MKIGLLEGADLSDSPRAQKDLATALHVGAMDSRMKQSNQSTAAAQSSRALLDHQDGHSKLQLFIFKIFMPDCISQKGTTELIRECHGQQKIRDVCVADR